MTRYELVRASIAYFAASADEQLRSDISADDAVTELPYPVKDMLACEEITPEEAAHIERFDDVVARYCSQPGRKPWQDRTALVNDPGWADVRRAAAMTRELLFGRPPPL